LHNRLDPRNDEMNKDQIYTTGKKAIGIEPVEISFCLMR
jgi:hypothetical protein